MQTVARLFLALILLFQLTACSAPSSMLQSPRSVVLQWPEKPLKPQVEWVKSVVSPEDAGIAKGFWKKALELFTGAGRRQLVRPYGVLYHDGRLFIADTGAGVVHVMDTKHSLYSVIASTPEAPLRSPISLARDGGNGLYITDSVSDAVYRYDMVTGRLTTFLRSLDRPTGIAYNRANNLLYVSETGANDVIGVNAAGVQQVRFSAMNPGTRLFNHPTDLAVDAKGQVFVTDPLNYKIRIFTPEGMPVGDFGEMGDAHSELSKPKGLAVDAWGRIFLCDAMLDLVKVFNDQGHLLFTIGGTGTADGQFWLPSGISIAGDLLFVSDTYNRRIQIFRMLWDADGEDVESRPGAGRGEHDLYEE